MEVLKLTLEVKVYNKNEALEISFENPMAHIMEYGTLTQAAEPFIRPSIEEVKKDIPMLIKRGGIRAVAEAIVEKAREKLKIVGREKVGDQVSYKEVDK